MLTTSLNLAQVRPSDRLSVWRDFASRNVTRMTLRTRIDDSFSACITARKNDLFSCVSFIADPHEILAGRDSQGDRILVSVQLDGHARICLDAHELVQRPGEIVLVDARRELKILFPSAVRKIVLSFPAVEFERLLPEVVQSRILKMPESCAASSIIRSYFKAVVSDESGFFSRDPDVFFDHICGLIRLGLGDRLSLPTRDIQRQAILNHIRRYAGDKKLSLPKVAAALGLSPRLLQKLLHERGLRFSSVLLSERLQRAKRLLRSRAGPISLIAYECGFSDVSHFNHMFRRNFGTSPTAFCVSRMDLGDKDGGHPPHQFIVGS